MGPRRPISLFVRLALILSASLALANCSTAPGLHRDQVAVERMTVPSEAQEIPLQEPVLDLPTAPAPEAPQVASNVPNPRPPASARKPAPLVKPVPPQDTGPEPDAVAPSDLVGFDFPAVLQVLRRPDNVQNSALSIVWTYSQSDCSLQLYFYPDIQTRIFHLLKYDLKDGTGEKPNDSSACMRRIMARNDEPALP